MYIQTLATPPALASSTPTPSLAGPGTCFVCSEPSDTILIIQVCVLLGIMTIHFLFLAFAPAEPTDPKSPYFRIIIAVMGMCYVTTVIHATLKFFLDDYATSRDGPRGFRRGFISGLTKSGIVFGPGNYWVYFCGLLWFVMWWKQGGVHEESDDEEREEVREVGEETPLMAGRSAGSNLERGGTDEGRFRVLLKGMWGDGAVNSGRAAA